MWPALVQLLELAPHVTRLVPMADRYLQTKADSGKAQRRALEEMAERLRGDMALTAERTQGDLTRVTAAQAGIFQQLKKQNATLERLAADLQAARATRRPGCAHGADGGADAAALDGGRCGAAGVCGSGCGACRAAAAAVCTRFLNRPCLTQDA